MKASSLLRSFVAAKVSASLFVFQVAFAAAAPATCIEGDGTCSGGSKSLLQSGKKLTSDDAEAAAFTVQVTSVDHFSGAVGKYFNFDWDRALGSTATSSSPATMTVKQCRSGRTIWTGPVDLFRAGPKGGSNGWGGSTGNSVGRRDFGAAPGQWQAGDVFTSGACQALCKPVHLSNNHPDSSTDAGACKNRLGSMMRCADYCRSLPTCQGFWYYYWGRCCPKATWAASFNSALAGGAFYACQSTPTTTTVAASITTTTTTTTSTKACAQHDYSASGCRIKAQELGLQVGGGGYAFAGRYKVTGCYAYNGGSFSGMAFYGYLASGGEVQSSSQLTVVDDAIKYRVTVCKKACVSFTDSVNCPAGRCVWDGSACQAQYIFGDLNSNVCQSGYSSITNMNVCRAAAQALGRSYYGAGSWNTSPGGCHADNYQKHGHWYAAFTSSAGIPKKNQQKMCIKQTTTTTTATTSTSTATTTTAQAQTTSTTTTVVNVGMPVQINRSEAVGVKFVK